MTWIPTPRRLPIAPVVSLLIIVYHSGVYGQATQQVSRSDVIKRIRNWNDSINSLSVRIESQHLNDTSDDVVTLISAAKGKKRFSSLWHGPEELKDLDLRTESKFYNEEVFDLFIHFSRRYETTIKYANEDYLWKVQRSMYFEALGWWPPTDDSHPPNRNGEPDFLPDILSDPRLQLNGTKIIRGKNCDVLEIPRLVRIYVDRKWGVPHQREQLRENDGPSDPWATFYFHDYEECNGVPIPRTIERIFPDHKLHTLAKVISCQVNNVPDSFFSIELPPGTMVINRDTGEATQIPGGLDCMHRLLDNVAKRIPVRRSESNQQSLPYPLMISLFAIGWFCATQFPFHNRLLSRSK
ncbi:hypothetical protein [Gimesia sp.]|uniref:hypothetical protein n=1 Tax=Gimesia sp. TaxID=2024833 RepID=UPI003A905FA7